MRPRSRDSPTKSKRRSIRLRKARTSLSEAARKARLKSLGSSMRMATLGMSSKKTTTETGRALNSWLPTTTASSVRRGRPTYSDRATLGVTTRMRFLFCSTWLQQRRKRLFVFSRSTRSSSATRRWGCSRSKKTTMSLSTKSKTSSSTMKDRSNSPKSKSHNSMRQTLKA